MHCTCNRGKACGSTDMHSPDARTALRNRRPQKGLATVELALLMPTLMLLVFGVIELGRLLWTQSVLDHATQATARFAMVRGETSPYPASAQDVIDEFRRNCISMDLNRVNIEFIPPWPENSAPGSALQIRVGYTFVWNWPLRWADDNVSLRSSVMTTVSQ